MQWLRHRSRAPGACPGYLLTRSEVGRSFQLFGVPRPLDRDLRGGALDRTKIVRREFDSTRADVLL
jgi:hypothetical protein